MSSTFDDLFAAVDPLLDDHFGEAFTLLPQKAPAADRNARKGADPDRAGLDFRGIWSAPHAEYWPESRSGHAQSLAGKFGDEAPSVDYVTATLPYRCQIGDVVVRQTTGQRYSVADIDNDDVTRTSLRLTSGSNPTGS